MQRSASASVCSVINSLIRFIKSCLFKRDLAMWVWFQKFTFSEKLFVFSYIALLKFFSAFSVYALLKDDRIIL